METAPLITIITVTYNAADSLRPTLQSVKEQDYENYEHLVIDGASTDNTRKVVSSIANPRLRFVSEPDKGIYDAMNKGLRRAQGKYVLFLNAGDSFSHKGILSAYAAEAEKNKDIIYGDTVIVNDAREVIAARHHSVPFRLSFKSFSKGMLICHQAFMVKKAISPLYDLYYKFSADYDWTIKCILASNPDNCANLHTVSIHYLSNGTTDKNKVASLKERYRIMERHYGIFRTFINHIYFVYRAIKRKYF